MIEHVKWSGTRSNTYTLALLSYLMLILCKLVHLKFKKMEIQEYLKWIFWHLDFIVLHTKFLKSIGGLLQISENCVRGGVSSPSVNLIF